MSDNIRRFAGNFFSSFNNLTQKWSTITQQMRQEFQVLKNQAEQLQHIENATIDEFSDFPNLRENLVFKIFISIDEALESLHIFLNELNSATNDLKSKLNNFEKSTTNVDWEDPEQTSGTPIQPSLIDLLQLAYEGWCIYNNLNQNLSNAIKSLNVRDVKTFNTVQFEITEENIKKVREIIALTQYCYDTEILNSNK